MIRVIESQSLFDIAIQESGSVLAAFDLALTNGLSITDELAAAQLLQNSPKKEYEVFDISLFLQTVNKRNIVVTVIENQSLLDIAIQSDGSVLASFEWALNNNISITDLLTPGQKMKMPKSEVFRYEDLANYFNRRSLATGYSIENSDLPIVPEGIGAMIIETNFIVN